MMAMMSLVLVLSVTWVTLALVVLGACVAAGRADRAVVVDFDAIPPFPGPAGEYAASMTLTNGAMGGARRQVGAYAPAARRGARHGGVHAGSSRR
jgi:hypothetical protein